MAQRYGKGYSGPRSNPTLDNYDGYGETSSWVYSDIDFLFRTTLTNDLSVKYDAESIKQSVKNILLTNKFERPYNPDLGVNLRDLLFENPDSVNFFFQTSAKGDDIKRQLARYEPRIKVENVEFKLSENGDTLFCNVDYKLQPVNKDSIEQTVIVKIQAERVR